MNTTLCFGELLLRMSPMPQAQWIQDAQMPVFVGGAELNVATALASWQQPVRYCTALPNNSLSEDISGVLKEKNIDVSSILFSGDRIGLYYLTQGTDLKDAGVIYDRAHSSFSDLEPGTIDWDDVLDEVNWFHFSAITPALSPTAALVCKEALEAAAKRNITISIDLNYRSKLWQYGKQPIEIMPELVQYCDVIMGNIWSAHSLLEIAIDTSIHEYRSKSVYLQHATETARFLMQQFPKCKTVAQTFRFDENDGIKYYGTLNDMRSQYLSHEYEIDNITDKVGSGDCFMAGLIYGLQNNHKPQDIIDFAAAAAVGKMKEAGDSTQQTVEMVLQLMDEND